ncbi:MAG: adenine deaminase [Lewinellaceae bacterium]|nr:adenine deaminase [Phaeodactylibacter sp.]MCB9038328.1 adenine deaminase [Lewinellaceae bacterium]
MKIFQGQLVDLHTRDIYPAEVRVQHGRIAGIRKLEKAEGFYILPGFVDAHVHIESSMLVPSEFARLAVVHGTVATVSDPHEIANVLGVEGVHYMIENGRKTPFKFNFGAPSCVPATAFETAGATIGAAGVEELLRLPEVKYLAEMMNYPGVIHEDKEVMAKLAIAQKLGKPIDGHAPGLRGEDARRYFQAGISTDHECFAYQEGLEKLQMGVKVIIREGSAAKNFNALIRLLPQFPGQVMFCSDDKHPDDLLEGHINQLAARALAAGCDLFEVLRAACVNPVQHYGLDVGLLRPGDPADFIMVENLEPFKVRATYIGGELVAENGLSRIGRVEARVVNNFHASPKQPEAFRLPAQGGRIRVIRALNGEIVTESFEADARIEQGYAVSDSSRDILKMAVVNRYEDAPPALAFINGFALKGGAIASCVGHDSHNIIAVGADERSICRAVNLIIANKGGIAAVFGGEERVLPLPVAGIMANADGYEVARAYKQIDAYVKQRQGCSLSAPFMTLSFMALLVIPSLKLGDKGLFDGQAFGFTPLFVSG